MAMTMMSRANTRRMLVKLEEAYPDAKCALNYSTPFELLIATMLSAQSTDVRVNMVTERLFQKYRGPEDYAAVTSDILQEDIKELGLFRAKADHIVGTSQMILELYHGEVPQTVEELIVLPGVGRKTANVVLYNAFGIPTLAVDTHVRRVSNRIGLASSMNPDIAERQLCQRIPERLWGPTHHQLIFHGRQVCTARNPKCEICPVTEFCAFYQKLKKDQELRKKVFVKKPVQQKGSRPRRPRDSRDA